MGTAKKFNDLGRISILTLLLTAMTSLCFAPVSMATDATFLTIPALGRTSQLGFLYDERTDKFRPISVFSKPVPPSVVIETLNTDVATETQATNTFDQKIQLLEISLNGAANILVGNTKVRGTTSILKQEKENSLMQQETLLRTHHTIEESLQVFYMDLRPFFNTHLLQHKDATHIVSGISWGSRISVTLQITATPELDADELSDAFYDEFEKIKGRPSTFNGINTNLNFAIVVNSDIPLPEPDPTTSNAVAILLNKIPQLINDTNGGKGVPLEFTLTPISELRSHLNVQTIINNSVHNIKESVLRGLTRSFDDISNSEQRLNGLCQNTYLQFSCLPSELREEIADLRTTFLDHKKRFVDNLKETLVDVRSGSKPSSVLTDIVGDFKRSNFSSRSVKNKIREYDDVIEKIAFCETIQTSYSNIEYFPSSPNLIPRISENSERPIYILFIKTVFEKISPVKYTEDLSTFLKTLYVPSNKLFIVDCDGADSHVFCSNLNQSEIHEYRNGKLTSTDFQQDSEKEEEACDQRKDINDSGKGITIFQNVTGSGVNDVIVVELNKSATFNRSGPGRNLHVVLSTAIGCSGIVDLPEPGKFALFEYKSTETYSNNEQCVWTLRNLAAGNRQWSRLKVTLIDDGLQSCCDKVSFLSLSRYADLISKPLSSMVPEESGAEWHFLSFLSDSCVTGTGFIVRIDVISILGGFPSLIVPFATSPGSYTKLATDSYYQALIVVTSGNRESTFSVESIDIQVTGGCSVNNLQVFEISLNSNFARRAKLCGNLTSSPASFRTTFPVIALLGDTRLTSSFKVSWT